MEKDYSELVKGFKGIACVMSLRTSDSGSDDIFTVACANKTYLRSVNRADEEFVPNRPYTYYVPGDPNFEALVRSCITDGKISHQYINAGQYNAWLDVYMLPLEPDEDGNGYCLFTYEMYIETDSDKMIDISARSAYMVLKTCIKFRGNYEFKSTMDSIVRDIRNQCESDGCVIILTDPDKRQIDLISYDHSDEGIFAPTSEDVFFKPEFYETVEKWRDIIGESNCFIISDENELKEVEKKDAKWYSTLMFSGVKNLVLYPLRVRDELYGYIFATNFNSDQTHFIREVMELNSFVLSSEVENYRMRQKLELFSRTDMLTGVLNRNAMNKRVTELESFDSSCGLGAVFVDVNGLKEANDTKGHNAGDAMLKNVARKLQSVYTDNEIFRAGGDEFLIITDMDKEAFYEHFERLKALSRIQGEPTFALGAHYEESLKEISRIMAVADQNMYRDKAEYYESNPHLKRRKE